MPGPGRFCRRLEEEELLQLGLGGQCWGQYAGRGHSCWGDWPKQKGGGGTTASQVGSQQEEQRVHRRPSGEADAQRRKQFGFLSGFEEFLQQVGWKQESLLVTRAWTG